ncbi:unnamed protein product [Didymodactylos carnosus]|uniref:Uncharacterized protein n=1 Tax=Didymodactylos carnosus TaxID=1234261 RepID=A0A815S1J8_9BILA|nr:unnamed protein product [Didymodactylos carnosus]CAF1484788.1 unnamed protein product [Didymodactylos carnosus]CAF4151262.1 unnamed protein product [Didymodactylos carnosus]CAF4349061.1 unnamed protein product [Didymodactylos carnosus]
MTSIHEQIPNAFEQNRLNSWSRNVDNGVDRLAVQRARHLELRDVRASRPKSVTDNEDNDNISDWSESDRECCPLSDYESSGPYSTGISITTKFNYNDDIDDQIDDEIPVSKLDDDDNDIKEEEIPDKSEEKTVTDMSLTSKNDEVNNTSITPHLTLKSFSRENNFKANSNKKLPQRNEYIITRSSTIVDCYHRKPKTEMNEPKLRTRENTEHSFSDKRSITNALKTNVRRSSVRSSISIANSQIFDFDHHKIPPNRLSQNLLHNNTRLLRRDTAIQDQNKRFRYHNQTLKETISPNNSFQSNDKTIVDETIKERASPNFSLNSTVIEYSRIPTRAYELKRLMVDDWGRLTDTTNIQRVPSRTIVHPPFPLGYQRATHEQVVDVVERLNSPVRCRLSHTPSQSPTKKYLSIEETDALINRLTKVRFLQTDQCYTRGRMAAMRKINALTPHAWKSTTNGIPT